MKLNSNKKADEGEDYNNKSKVISNKSIDESERKTQPVVATDTEEQRYSSRVVNTEPLFVKHVENSDIDFIENIHNQNDPTDDDKNIHNRVTKNKSHRKQSDRDDPSSSMS